MPNIREYQPPQEGLRPQEIGVEATAAAARRGGAFFNQAGQSIASAGQEIGSALSAAGKAATDYMAHREISAGSAHFATMESGFTSAWNNTLKRTQLDPKDPNFLDPNEPGVADRFRAEMEPSFNQFKDSFLTDTGRDWAEGHVERFREHMMAKTNSDVGTMAKNAVSLNLQKTANEQANRVFFDPSALEDAIASFSSSSGAIIKTSPNVDAAGASSLKLETEKVKGQLVKSALMGMITNGAETADWQKVAKKYAQYISAPEIQQFERAEKSQQRANLYYQRATEALQKSQDVDAANKAHSKNFTDNVTWEGDKVTVNPDFFKQAEEIERKSGGVAFPRYEATVKFAQDQIRQKKEAVVTDGPTHIALLDGVLNGTKNDIDILTASNKHLLDPRDRTDLLALHKSIEDAGIRGPLYTGTMEAVKGMLGTNTMADGPGRYATFLHQFIPAFLKLPEAERLGALDKDDPNSLISKSMKDLIPTQKELIEGIVAKKYHQPMPVKGAAPSAAPSGGTPVTAGQEPTTGVLPLPKFQNDLIGGRTYQTSKGPAIWDAGTNKFITP